MSREEIDTVAGAAAALEAGALSSRELVTERLAAIDRDPALNAFITVTAERALAAADAADRRRRDGEATALTGVPIALKDIFCTRDVRTTAGSRILQDWIAPYDATVTERLDAAGAVSLGKTNMDEFAMGSSGENSHFGATLNPWDRTRVPGGSSSGSAAAIAAGLVPGAIGTDTGGSIRQPAAFCGLTGLKPTYGRVSRWGMIAFASSLDQAGPLGHSAEDVALLLDAIAGFDPRDSTSVDRPAERYADACGMAVTPFTVGIPEHLFEALSPALAGVIDEARAVLEGLGVRCVPMRLDHASSGVAAYYVIAPAEASTNLSRFDGVRFGHRCEAPTSIDDLYARTRAEGFGAEVKRRILTGTYALSVGYYEAYYRRAQRVRRLIRDEFLAAFGSVDAILTPTTPTPAFPLGDKTDDPVAMYLQDVFTIPANLAGIPGLSMPAGRVEGLPVGVQLLGTHFAERTLIALAAAFQRETDHHLQRPAGAGS
ncbi:MAG: Asp-tRNA(Asn)/Glu-tRNA(Gln) amidotransferase subunit GatA [Pseudomonadales bacterium]|jgi:aspartyl-tRNA(Asn)/glutamyl-tRNA(Gln) amidotransferase subunit A|nr:Asp-tRNA(Asn)/Glu-tRNA(Gln) amidotransferase subunit GatA [Pseudomonadales bacterium]